MTAQIPTMSVLRESSDIHEEKQNAIRNAWAFVHAALWRNETFTEKEVLNFRYLITEHFDPSVSPEKNFTRFCVRVMLAKRYVQKSPGYRLPRPALWLNKNFENGFSKTKQWYEDLLQKRTLVGAYAQPLFVLARGVYKYSIAPNTPLFQLYREKLHHLKAYNCLDVFYNAILFQNHLI
ncbi:MAG: hypothetical protein ACOZCO_10635 [Bacteroidota bacterium]